MAKAKPTKKPKVSISKVNRQITIGFVLVTIILLLIITYFSLSRATILLTPNQTNIEKHLDIEVVPEVTSTLKSSNILPGSITITEASSSDTFTASQEKQMNVKSEGVVTIINSYSKDQTLVKTTRLMSESGALFRTTETVVAPAGGQATVHVEADDLGTEYEIGAGKFTIPGLWEGLQDKIYGVSDQPMSKSNLKQKIVTIQDLEQAKETLLERIEHDTVSSFENNDIFVLADTEIVSTDTNATAGKLASDFTFTVVAKVTTVVIDKTNLETVAENNLKISVPENLNYQSYNPNSIKVTLKHLDAQGQAASLDVYVAGTALENIEGTYNKSDILGFAKQDVERYFYDLPSVESVLVKFTPSWVKSVPPLEDHVEIKIIK